MIPLPKKLEGLELYEPAAARGTVCLDANESCFPLSEELREALSRSMLDIDVHRYPDPLCTRCRTLAADYFGVPADCLAAGNGSDGLIDALLGAFFESGDSLLCADPDFSMYRFYAGLRQISVRSLPRKAGLPDPDEIIAAAEGVQGLIFSNPCNPTGQGLPRAVVLRVLDRVRCLVVLDEAYMDFFGESAAAEAAARDNVIVLKTCSKAMGLAGIRLGFAIACPERARFLRQLKSPYDVSSLTQAAGAVLLSRPEFLRARRDALIERRRALYKELRDWAAGRDGIDITDTVTNFVLLCMAEPERLHRHLWAQGIAVRLLPGALRITAGSEEEHQALRAALDDYRL